MTLPGSSKTVEKDLDLVIVRATLHPVLPGRSLILHKLVSKLN